jgi:glycosyltransferase EpsE
MDKILPKVSVIMGIYNCAPYLQEALDSLYAQTFQDFEIVLCDDGSCDNTYEIAKKNADAHPNIKLLRNERNMGLNMTLNNCLAVAEGQYIARMDGDDISLPTRFEKEVDFLDSHPEFAIVSCPMIYFDENGEFARGKAGGEQTKDVLNYSVPFCHAPCMVRKEAYDAVGGYTVDSRLLRYEDYNLWMKMFALGFRGYNISECLYAMRDDRKAAKRRTFRGRLNGIYAHKLAYETLGLSLFSFWKFAFVSIFKGLLPGFVYRYLHRLKQR